MRKPIDIVIATYNGEQYIRQQLNSIFHSQGFEFLVETVIISDDGSTDNTLGIIEEFQDKVVFSRNENDHGVVSNFHNAISMSSADYIVLSDQDDIWTEDKLQVLYDGITQLESNSITPCLYFSDLYLINCAGYSLGKSFWHSQKIEPNLIDNPPDLLFRNVSPGCAMIINRALSKNALPHMRLMAMHDWWLINYAGAFGKIGFTNSVTTFYRQHDSNVVGAKRSGFLTETVRIFKLILSKNSKRNVMLESILTEAEKLNVSIDNLYHELNNYPNFSLIKKIRFLFNSNLEFRHKIWLLIKGKV